VSQKVEGRPSAGTASPGRIAPADGTYWVLFGEDHRQSFDLKIEYSGLAGADAACSADSEVEDRGVCK
jgi:hypothetical protein